MGYQYYCGCSKVKKYNPPRYGGVVAWWSGVVFITDNNAILGLHWDTLGCGNKVDWSCLTTIISCFEVIVDGVDLM